MAKNTDPRAAYIAISEVMFAADGYHGTSLAALAAKAGVSKQALLHFFGKKETLYAAVLESLADRLIAQVQAAYDPDPRTHLKKYFLEFLQSTRTNPADVRLVVRALLDSDPAARKWPLKPYLDALCAIARQTPGGQNATVGETMAWLSQMIGMVQYVSISATAVSGMYGHETSAHMFSNLEHRLTNAVDEFATGR